jgi:hypothetical protein
MTHADRSGLESGFSGGCQCGACRFEVAPGPVGQTLCHCRMCQRAVSGPFAALVEVPEERVTWSGMPALYSSSSIAERGFCAKCGSPLFCRSIGSGVIEFAAGALDRPEAFWPTENAGIERLQPWLESLTALPGRATAIDPGISLVCYQDARGS